MRTLERYGQLWLARTVFTIQTPSQIRTPVNYGRGQAFSVLNELYTWKLRTGFAFLGHKKNLFLAQNCRRCPWNALATVVVSLAYSAAIILSISDHWTAVSTMRWSYKESSRTHTATSLCNVFSFSVVENTVCSIETFYSADNVIPEREILWKRSHSE